jgi:ubiquinone/menaquinone biosynthesis C-methylase UbiE
MNKETKVFFEKAGFRYAKFQEERYLDFCNIFDEISWLQFSKYLPSNKNAYILDAGCGGGAWSLRLAKMGYENLFLLDFAFSCLSGAQALHVKHGLLDSISLIQADLENLQCIVDNTFDYIFCERDPLEYCIYKQEEAFGSLVRILKPNGKLTLSIGNSFPYVRSFMKKKLYNQLFSFIETGILQTEEGKLKPISIFSLKQLIAKYNVKLLEISGRLTIADRLSDEQHSEIYQDAKLKDRIIAMELEYQNDECFAATSSHIFAAMQKR